MSLRALKARYLDGSLLRRRLLSGGSWAFGGRIAGALVGVVTNGLLARMLSPEEFGAYFLSLSIISLGAVVGSLGLTRSVVRYVAENVGLNQLGRARRAILLVFGLGLLGAAGTGLAYYLVVGDLLGKYLFHSSVLVGITGLVAGWMAISVVQEIMAETFRGFHDIRMATLLGGLATGGKSGGLIMRGILLACLALLWVASGKIDLATVMLVSIGSGAISAFLALWLLRAKVASLHSTEAEESAISPKVMILDALPNLVIALTVFVIQSSDIWIVGALASQEDVAIYGSAARLVALIGMPLIVVNLVVPPIIAEMYSQGQTDRLERMLRAFSTATGLPALVLLGGFMLLGAPILGLVYGPYYQAGAAVLVILSVGKVFAVWAGSCGSVLQFTGHQNSMMRVNVFTAPLFFAGALLAVREYGPVGVAAAAAAITVLQNVLMVLLARRKTGMWTHVTFSPSAVKKALSGDKPRQ